MPTPGKPVTLSRFVEAVLNFAWLPNAETTEHLVKMFKAIKDVQVPMEVWVCWSVRANEKDPELIAWHKNHNLWVFFTEAEAVAKAADLNKYFQANDRHDWETRGLHVTAEKRSSVELRYALQRFED